jgi:hypothetical protein
MFTMNDEWFTGGNTVVVFVLPIWSTMVYYCNFRFLCVVKNVVGL